MTDIKNRAQILLSTLVSPTALADRLADVVVVDISDPQDFEARHIAGARNIPLFWNYRVLDEEGGLARMAECLRAEFLAHGIDGRQPIVFTEQNPAAGFGRSARAWFMAEHLGIPSGLLHILDGGNLQWDMAGLTVERGSTDLPAAVASLSVADRHGSHFLSQGETEAAVQRGAKLIDVRNPPEFLAQAGAPYAVIEGDPPQEIILSPGRLPGAVGLSWTDVFESEGENIGKFKSAAELSRLFGSAGITPADEVVVYCFKGARASAVLFALYLAGFEGAKSYFAGWNEWARRDGLPMETGRPGKHQLAGSYARELAG